MPISESVALAIPDVLIITPKVLKDQRGLFFESFHQRDIESVVGMPLNFVQDNQSQSAKGVLRGLHYQIQQAQGKLVRVIEGEIFDVAVDLRRSSPTFGQSVSATLSSESRKMMWVPAGFAHGFIALTEGAMVLYKTTDYYAPEHERTLWWNDPALGIEWPLGGASPILSNKDTAGKSLAECETYP